MANQIAKGAVTVELDFVSKITGSLKNNIVKQMIPEAGTRIILDKKVSLMTLVLSGAFQDTSGGDQAVKKLWDLVAISEKCGYGTMQTLTLELADGSRQFSGMCESITFSNIAGWIKKVDFTINFAVHDYSE